MTGNNSEMSLVETSSSDHT